MDLENAVKYWVSESGYRKIQSELSRRSHKGVSKYALENYIEHTNKETEKAREAADILQSEMKPSSMVKQFYRGMPSKITNTHIREGFFSVTSDRKKAESYGEVYTVLVDKDVPRLNIHTEGGETLVAPGMVYRFRPTNIKNGHSLSARF